MDYKTFQRWDSVSNENEILYYVLKVRGGWLVSPYCKEGIGIVGITYIDDPEHRNVALPDDIDEAYKNEIKKAVDTLISHPKSFQKLVEAGKDAISPLTIALRSTNSEMRKRACNVLAEIGKESKKAIGSLLLLIKDPIPDVAKAAAAAIEKIDPETYETSVKNRKPSQTRRMQVKKT